MPLDLPLVFVPISLRFNTASQAIFFATLAARLAHLYGEPVPADLSHAPDFWRGMVGSFLSQPLPQGRLLVLLDGLDEATDWRTGADLFSFQPPPGLRVVVSARCLAGETGAQGWLRRLDWERGRARALAVLAPHLPPALREQTLSEALAAVREIAWGDIRAQVLTALAPHLTALPHPALYRLWDETLRALARRTRRDLLADLRALQPLILYLGGPQAIAETFRAIQDVVRWWP